MKIFGIMAACVALAACASPPEKIPAQYVSELQYQSYDCQQLEMEARRISARTGELYGNVKKLADNDSAQMGVGLILFWPTLFFLEGGDGPEAAEYARLQGEADAMERAAVSKKCMNKLERWEKPVETQEAQS